MEIIFTRSRNRWDQTIATRQDGVRVRVPVFGPLNPIPHDLAHYVIEHELGLQDGFWGRVAAGGVAGAAGAAPAPPARLAAAARAGYPSGGPATGAVN